MPTPIEKHVLAIAVDGPSGSGKSTVAKLVAQKLGLTYVNTGLMYRAVAFLMKRSAVSPEDQEAIGRVLDELELRVAWLGPEMHVFANGEDITSRLRGLDIDQTVPVVAALKVTREKLLTLQRHIAAEQGVVMEGRDIGSVVLPRADLKIFLDASPEVRAERRWKEHQEKGEKMTVAEVFDEVIERDKRDRERKVSPLIRAKDAVLVDNTAMGIEETARLIVMLAQERQKEVSASAGRKT